MDNESVSWLDHFDQVFSRNQLTSPPLLSILCPLGGINDEHSVSGYSSTRIS